MLLIAAILSSPFTAIGEEVTEQAKQESKKHFQQGDAYVQAGAYKSAAEEFLEAYRLWPNERFHYNIAQAYRLGGEKEKAVEHYKRYLAAVSDGDTASDARQQLAVLMTDIEREQAARAAEEKAAAEKAAADRAAAERAAAERLAIDKAQTSAADANLVTQQKPVPTKHKVKPWVWAVVGIGAAVVVGTAVGLGVGLTSGDKPLNPSFGSAVLR
jgi:colicin import membrane protein